MVRRGIGGVSSLPRFAVVRSRETRLTQIPGEEPLDGGQYRCSLHVGLLVSSHAAELIWCEPAQALRRLFYTDLDPRSDRDFTICSGRATCCHTTGSSTEVLASAFAALGRRRAHDPRHAGSQQLDDPHDLGSRPYEPVARHA